MRQTRRDFLKTAVRAGALFSFASSTPAFLKQAAFAAETSRTARDTVLVVLQLSGGNDGLNTVIPYGDDEYAKSRPTIRFSGKQILKIDDYCGFHPRMKGFKRLFGDGQLSVIQGVGYANSNRDHPGGKTIWQTADVHLPGPQTGWLGRIADHMAQQDAGPVPAIFVGNIPPPQAINAAKVLLPAIRSPKELLCQAPPTPAATHEEIAHPWMEFLQQTTSQIPLNNRRIEAAMGSASEYPHFQLAAELRSVAQLIRADIGIRVFNVELGGGNIGGFDNHAGQLGNHCALLEQLSESVAAFVADLKRDGLLDRVLLMTFSEFGRTLRENGRRGTDHGAAAPVFVAGGRIRGGLIGKHPNLTDLEKDAPKHLIDFRQVYATVLERWLGIDSRSILGEKFDCIEMLKTA